MHWFDSSKSASSMNVVVRMPNWLGDAVMAMPAIVNLRRHDRTAHLIAVASPAVAALLAGDPLWHDVIADRSKEYRLRPWGIRQEARALRARFGPIDLAIALPGSVSSRLFLWQSDAKERVGIARGLRDRLLTCAIQADSARHQAEIYNQIVTAYLGSNDPAGPPRLHVARPHAWPRPTLGINPGAAYGSAKRWLPERFAAVAASFASKLDIAIFGSPREAPLAGDIARSLESRGISNFVNLAGGTSIPELVGRLASLRLLVTNDSGPMHIAGAFQVPTVAIFGPTNHRQIHPWAHRHLSLVRHELPCAPCMKRSCPLGHHECMQRIAAAEVARAARDLFESTADRTSEGDAAAQGHSVLPVAD